MNAEKDEASFVSYARKIALANASHFTESLSQKERTKAYLEERLRGADRSPRASLMPLVSFSPKPSKLRTQIIRVEGQIRQIREYLSLIGDEEQFRNQYREILKIPRVVRAYANEQLFFLETDTLFGKDEQGDWHCVNAYKISCDARPSHNAKAKIADWERFVWINRGGAVPVPGSNSSIMTSFSADSRGKRSCLGDAMKPLMVALSHDDFVSLAEILVRFPECPGLNDAIRLWPRVPVDRVPQWYIDTFGR